jgi:peptidase M23-like protein
MASRRTTARGFLFTAALLGLSVGTAFASASGRPPAHIIFPVVAQVQYTDDFGQPRPGGAHQGNDIMAPKKAPAVAAEAGKVKYWTTSRSAGCMLYVYGASGTTYDYIHLNNDLTSRNDNRGKCVRGVAYTVRNGARVAAGQQIGYVGDSGDADGVHAHLHFEVHPNGGKATDPYPYLQAAQKLLFASKPGAPFALTLTGTVIGSDAASLTVKVTTSQAYPSNLTLKKLNQTIVLGVPPTALVQTVNPNGVVRTASSVATATTGQSVVVWTQPAPATLKAQRGDPLALSAALVQLSA